MADVFDKAKRSHVMSLIRGKGNKDTELRLIQLFQNHGIVGWRRGWPLMGKPDFVFPRLKLVIFVDGCFWHGCPKHFNQPVNNADFWLKKLSSNRARDRLVTRMLRSKGWRVIRIWEHDLTNRQADRLVLKLNKVLASRQPAKCKIVRSVSSCLKDK